MFGGLYLLLATWVGCGLCNRLLPRLTRGLLGHGFVPMPAAPGNSFITLPMGFVVGTLLMTWVTYIAAYLSQNTGQPMACGNIVSFAVFGGLAIVFDGQSVAQCVQKGPAEIRLALKNAILAVSRQRLDWLFILLALSSATLITFHTLRIDGHNLLLGGSVHGDMSTHISTIRSFSIGQNFPTEYPLFPNGHMNYHFMFDFLAGNMEFLGLPLDIAYNLPSILSLGAFWMLFYGVGLYLTGLRSVNFVAFTLFHLRSSMALPVYLWDKSRDVAAGTPWDFAHDLTRLDHWLGNTNYENWGMWCLPNVLANQRHNALIYGVMLMALLYGLPLYKSMIEALKRVKTPAWHSPVSRWLKVLFCQRDAWEALDWRQAVVMGILLGLTSSWNGAVLVTTLLILFFFALGVRHRLEFGIMAGLSVGLAALQKAFFEGNGSSAFHPAWVFGFAAPEHTMPSVLQYYLEAFGILFPLALLLCFVLPRRARWLVLIVLTPLLLATLVQFSTDIMNNHKFIHITIVLLNLFIAWFLVRLWTTPGVVKKSLASLLFLVITLTGYTDAVSFWNINQNPIPVNLADPITQWTLAHTPRKAMFLTDIYALHPVLLAGNRIFYGWPFYGWSIGYDTLAREQSIKKMIQTANLRSSYAELIDNHIDYIIVDDAFRKSQLFKVNEPFLDQSFRVVYEDSAARIKIYDIHALKHTI